MNPIIRECQELHVEWVRQHPHFVDVDTGRKGDEYIELICSLYSSSQDHFEKFGFVSRLCFDWLRGDIKRYNKELPIQIRLAALEKELKSDIDDNMLWAFITVGFNEQTITPEKMCMVSRRVSELKYFKTCTYVLEKHRENGIHHHTHFLVTFHDKVFKSKLIDWIYQIKGFKDVCLNKNFIDILGPVNAKKIYQPYEKYVEYISGNKKQDKLKYCLMDKKWRDENKIAHLFRKIE